MTGSQSKYTVMFHAQQWLSANRISSVIRLEFFSFQNLDPSYKMELDLWDCLGRAQIILQHNFYGTDLVICRDISNEGSQRMFSLRNKKKYL